MADPDVSPSAEDSTADKDGSWSGSANIMRFASCRPTGPMPGAARVMLRLLGCPRGDRTSASLLCRNRGANAQGYHRAQDCTQPRTPGLS